MSPTRRKKSRARKVLGVIGAVVGTTVTFVAATATAAVVHLDVPATRRLVATQVTSVLRSQLKGDVAIEQIGKLGLSGVEGVRVRVKDPEGMQVLFVDGARVKLRALEAARSALFGKGDIHIPVTAVSVEHVDAAIDSDAAGGSRIANAFLPKKETPPKPSDPNARGVSVDAPEVVLRHAWVHGVPAPSAPAVDTDVSDLLAHAHYDSKVTKVDLDRVDFVTRGMQPKVDPRGRVAAHLVLPAENPTQTMKADAAFEGFVADAPTTLEAKLDGEKIDARLDIRGATGERMRAAFGEVPLREEVTAHAEVHGTTKDMKATANVAVGRGNVALDADVHVGDETRVDAKLAARHLDARAAVATAPASDINLDVRARVATDKNGAVTGDFGLQTLASRLEGDDIPRVDVRGDFTKENANAVARIRDARMPTQIGVTYTARNGAQIVEADVQANVPELSRLPKVKAFASGAANVRAQARVDLARTKDLDARVEVKGKHIAASGQHVEDVRVLATASGTIDKPQVLVGVHAGGIRSGEIQVGSADVRARVAPGAATVVTDAQVDLVKEGHTVGVTAKKIQVAGPRIDVEGATITGLGDAIRGDFSKDASRMHVKVDAPAIDLQRVAAVAGRAADVKKGTLALKGDIALARDGAQGELHAKVERLNAFSIDGAEMSLDTKFAGRSIDVDLDAKLADAGTASLHTQEIVLGGSPSDPKSWQRASGGAKFSAIVDMQRIRRVLPQGSLPVGELSGQLTVAGTVRRDSTDVPPELSVHAHTRSLVVGGKAPPERPHDGEKVYGVAPWRSQGLDASFDARVDATSGLADVSFRAFDKTGNVVAFNAKSDLPYQDLLGDPASAMAKIKTAPVRAKLLVPKRALAELPEIFGTRGMAGTVEAELDVSGTVMEPRVAFVAHGREVRSPSLPVGLATDADVTLGYDGRAADLAAKVRSGGNDALELASHIDVAMKDVLEPKAGQELPWKGNARVKLASFPLDSINAISDLHMKGRVSGEAVIDGLHEDAKLHAQIGLEDLRIGRAQYRAGRIVVNAENGRLEASARLDQTDGYADVRAKTGISWGAAIAPTVDPNAPVEARLEAKGFRAAAALPFVQGTVNELDGRIDANATIILGQGGKDPRMEGKIVFREGRIQVAALGDEFQDARATVTFQPNGTIRVDDVFARSLEGQLRADALIKTRGLALDSATAHVRIPSDHELDVAMQGAPVGQVWGDININALGSPDGKKIAVNVEVPRFQVTVPQTPKSGIQELAEPEKIRVGTFRDAKTFVKLPLDKEDLTASKPEDAQASAGTALDVNVKLGDIVVVYGRMARIALTGNPHITMENGELKTKGQITTTEGKIDVQGKKFEIERCVVTLQEQDPANPIVTATASWTAEDGTKVYADFVGPVKTGKVNLRSEPTRPKNEIVALILFGTADGMNAQPPPPGRAPDGTTKAATTVGGGFATQGLSEAVDDLTGIEVTARIDSTRANNPAPELEIQIARRISLEITHVLGTPPISEPDKNLATIDWRFRRNWSLETTVGDRGKAQVDAVWQKRY